MPNKLLVVLAMLASGCRVFDSVADCHNICTRYRDCYDSNYGVMSCEERCRENATNDANYYKKVDNCSACIDNNKCATAVFTCGLDCSSVVP